ncbi:MAG: hypothetical protein DCF19_18540 [Pseudanabaena frigida]|uniref:histidine kinase n=1 Tax=Pseudanabaena frigida TaxID=945775 RepID=A0A2W4VYR5_9CYAN|nr:MAG: hypothetical protein DCF19_18540 [Pseudanabaena frigida]
MNSEQQQQRIMGYFIEEAREHLQTIEQGVLNLQEILDDSESINELFRAAHSIKGGAAMLGVGSIQHVAHRLEDFFKILKENPQITVDERLKSLLLAGFDPLAELLDELQIGYKISDELTNETSNRVKPVFAELESYLNQLVSDNDGVTSDILVPEKVQVINEPQKVLVSSLEDVFQQEVTTKMRDMLQLFRGNDSPESRSQLQTICNYFQNIGNNYDLRNWTNLVTQIKNAITQPSNTYRTLAPILIRELKEAQDLVLSNREAELAVSAQLQNLLPYRFSEPEDDEVSTIFTTASGDITDDAIDDLQIPIETVDNADIATIDRVDPDVDIDLFADRASDEMFNLSKVTADQADQMDWMDGEYEITENQHIDGPKVGASELKSLAILFENDDIDFDAAWEDIESNETNMSNHGSEEPIDSHDEFADLLSNNSDNTESSTPINLGLDESGIDQLFGDLNTDESTNEENKDPQASLFPEDLDLSWNQSSESSDENIKSESQLDDLITNVSVTDNALDSEFDDLDLGIDIIDRIDDIDLGTNVDDIDFDETVYSSVSSELFAEEEFVGDQDRADLSSEEYFAELERQENEEINSGGFNEVDELNEPFALEGMELLDEPFAIAENLDEDLLESTFNNDVDSISSDFDTFSDNLESDTLEQVESNNYAASISSSEDFDTIDTSGLRIFDELGFDNDDLSETLESQESEETSNSLQESFNESIVIDSNLLPDASTDDLLTSAIAQSNVTDISDDRDGLNFFNEIDGSADNSDSSSNIGSENELSSRGSEAESEFEFNSVALSSNDELSSVGSLDDFFSESEDIENIIDTGNANIDSFIDTVSSTDELEDFFVTNEEPQPTSINSFDFNDSSEEINIADELGDFFAVPDRLELTNDVSDANDLGDFFADSGEPEMLSNDDISNELSNSASQEQSIDDLGDFFENSDESEVLTDDLENESVKFVDRENSIDDLGDFFSSSEENGDENVDADLISNDWDDIGVEIQHDSVELENEFFDFDSPQVAERDEIEVPESVVSEENFFEQSSLGQISSLTHEFVNADENDLTVLENNLDDLNNDFVFNESRSLTQNDEVDNFVDVLDESASQLTSIDEHLTFIQEDFDLNDSSDIDSIAPNTTIDNLVDFFQGDDDSDISLLQTPEEENLVTDNFAVEEELDYGSIDEFADFDGASSELSGAAITENIETGNQLQAEELNGIDDNFDFDDLEAMIGNSSNTSGEVNQDFRGQGTDGSVNNQQSIDSDDMNFDELEALLGDSNGFEAPTANSLNANFSEISTPISTSSVKSNDEFDELEGMLRDTFGKDVGPIKTKTPVRPPTTQRKQRLTDSTMRVDVKYLDSLNNLVGELVVNRNLLEQDQERLQQFITNLLHQVQLLSDVSQRMRDQYDRSLLEASLTAGRGRSFSSNLDSSYSSDSASTNSSVTNDFEGIEFDRYNTFHVLSQEIIELIVRVRESASDIEFVVGETDQVTRQLGTITTQVQDDLKQSRMVPFAQIADRLPRGIRDRALKTGKQAELEIYGRETLIDKAILEQLTDPLTHLVNNAIDHGLEDPATRQAAGKSATGKLTVRAYHQGNQTVISISDDGAGISPERVKKSAVSKGVRSQSEVDRLNENEVYSLLFEPGFSTAAQADEFKGRGVGLDVVKTCLDEIRGVIIVESSIGKGTTFTIRLPLTLSISKAMFCISDRARVAFPVDGFEDMVEVPQSQIVLNEKGQPCLPWRDTILPFQHLSNLLSYSRHLSRSSIYGKQENDELCIIILRNDTSYLALQVDQFLGEYEIVIKQLEGPIPQPAGIAGATVLGDGRVMAIANVLELFDIASGRLRPSTSGVTVQPPVEEDIAVDPTVLIVDDSITVRELLSLTFAKVGYRVEQAKDGQDAWEKLRAGLPCDMIFCDIEMPRMDGLDLLSRLQKDSRLKEIPVAMLTSRGADRHRQSAIQLGAKGYFTKPYLEEELLSASKRLLNGETLPI